ncbi:MAG: hypothetical protein JST40_05580 [Armatimonadetes bacterium]|nr:hypothetical protein [Armatimonadota bacterium]
MERRQFIIHIVESTEDIEAHMKNFKTTFIPVKGDRIPLPDRTIEVTDVIKVPDGFAHDFEVRVK